MTAARRLDRRAYRLRSVVAVSLFACLAAAGCDEKFDAFAPLAVLADVGNLVITVTGDGNPLAGAVVAVSGPETQSGTTDTSGTVTFTGLTPGSYTVAATADGFTCGTATGNVAAGGTDEVTVSCTAVSMSFTAALNGGYRHNSTGSTPPSVVCGRISTTPAQAGASFSVTVTGPAVVGSGTVTGTLDGGGMATFEVGISSLGEYSVGAGVTSGGTTVSRSTSVTVASAQSSCP